MRKGKCVVCLRSKHEGAEIQRHHLFPRRFFGDGITTPMCSKCHLVVEKIIRDMETAKTGKRRKLAQGMYVDALVQTIHIVRESSWFKAKKARDERQGEFKWDT